MPYRFKIDEPIESGFRRIAREQLEAALHELSAPNVKAKGVHECRKSLKRLRALVRLAAPPLGKNKSRKRAKALGEIAQLLSGRRDQAVMLDTLQKIIVESGPHGALTLAPLGAHFAKHMRSARQPLDSECATQAHVLLLREAKKFARVRIRKHGFEALAGGLEQSYRRARKALTIAYSEPTDETFHALRKAVQWHWRQMSLLARAWPEEFAVRVTAARELSQLLGDDHDLALLIAATVKADEISPEEKEAIVGICLRKQQSYRAAAQPRAERIFAETPRAFVKRMQVYWTSGGTYGTAVGLGDDIPGIPQQAPAAASAGHIAPTKRKSDGASSGLSVTGATAAPSQRRA